MRKIITLAFLFCFFIAKATDNISISQEPVWLFPVKPDLNKKPDSREISNGYYLELLDRQREVSSQTIYTHFIRHIVNETGVQNASEVSVSYAPEYQNVVFHKIEVIRNGTVVSKINLSQIKVVQEETDAADFQYNGLKRAYVVLKDIRKDDRLDIAYSVIGLNPVFKNKISSVIYFDAGVAITNFYETIIAPKDRKLNFTYFNSAQPPAILEKDKNTYYHWRNPYLKPNEPQSGVPSWFNNYPYVTVTEYANWKEVINWGVALFQNYTYPIGASLKNKILEWQKEAAGDKSVYTVLATRFVQDQVRYLGFEIGAYTHKPHDPNAVFTQRYGDCKDKALLLAVILRAEGIPAYVALANTDLRSKITEQSPSPDQFNHAIVAIQREKGYRFIDATISFQRGTEAEIYMPAYGSALVLNENSANLELIDHGINKTTILEKLYVKNKGNGSSNLEVETDYEGHSADNIRINFSDYSIKDLEVNYRKYYSRFYDSIQTDQEIRKTDDSLHNKVHVSETYTIPELWHTDDKGKNYINVYAHFLSEQLPDPSTSYKEGPLAINYPLELHYTLELHLPDTWSFPFDDYHISNEAYQFDYTITRKDSIIILDYKFVTFKDHIPLERMNSYRTDYKLISNVLQYSLSRYGKDTGSTKANNESVSWVSLCVILVVLAAFTFLFLKLNRSEAYTPYVAGTGQKLGGWLIVLGVSFAITLLYQLYNFISTYLYTNAVWDRITEMGGGSLQALFIIEESVILFNICCTAAVSYWFLRRRDIFTRMFIGLVSVAVLGQFALLVCYNIIPYPSSFGDLGANGVVAIVRMIIYGAIWISYLLRSERAKTTFIEPYKLIPQSTATFVEENSVTKEVNEDAINNNPSDAEETEKYNGE